jgi:hypothetical protein
MDSITLEVDETTGLPCVRVPDPLIWSLVEYLAFRRIPADFSYRKDGFQAIFTRVSAPVAQQVLVDWAHYQMEASDAPVEQREADAMSAYSFS